MTKNTNMFSVLSYDSDNDEYEYEKIKKQEGKEKEGKRIEKEEKRKIKEIQRERIEEEKYAQSLKRTKVYDGIYPLDYVKLIKEDNYCISSYLSLSRDIQCSLNISNMSCALAYGGFQIFNKEEYLYLVGIMEKAKNPYYYNPTQQIEDMMSISETRLMKCYFSEIHKSIGYEFGSIYQIYKFLLWDTPNYRRFLKEHKYSHFKKMIDDEVKEFIENPYNMHSEIEHEYVSKYFELGKRYYAKRNNFKVLFRNYIRFIGKIMILYKK